MEEILNRLDGRLNQAEKLKRNFLYKELKWTLDEAFSQAACGKGKERHVTTQDQAFVDQPILVITRMVGPGFPLGQAMKKAQEAMRLPTTEAKVKELLGAINYLAAAIIYYKEMQANEESSRDDANPRDRDRGERPFGCDNLLQGDTSK